MPLETALSGSRLSSSIIIESSTSLLCVSLPFSGIQAADRGGLSLVLSLWISQIGECEAASLTDLPRYLLFGVLSRGEHEGSRSCHTKSTRLGYQRVLGGFLKGRLNRHLMREPRQ